MVQVKWIDIDKQQPEKDQFVLYISEADNIKYRYDDEKAHSWCYDFGLDTGNYWKGGMVEYHYDLPMVKIKYWSPAPRFDWDIY